MFSMDPVELAPLPNVQRTENWVVENPGAPAKPSFALCQSCVHLLNLRKNGAQHLFRGHPFGNSAFRRLPALRKVRQVHNQQRAQSMAETGPRPERSTLLQALGQPLVRIVVGEIQVLQYLRRSPLPFRAVADMFGATAGHCLFEFPPQLFQIGIHAEGPVQWRCDLPPKSYRKWS